MIKYVVLIFCVILLLNCENSNKELQLEKKVKVSKTSLYGSENLGFKFECKSKIIKTDTSKIDSIQVYSFENFEVYVDFISLKEPIRETSLYLNNLYDGYSLGDDYQVIGMHEFYNDAHFIKTWTPHLEESNKLNLVLLGVNSDQKFLYQLDIFGNEADSLEMIDILNSYRMVR